jgi:Ca-activated chloride channel homolog
MNPLTPYRWRHVWAGLVLITFTFLLALPLAAFSQDRPISPIDPPALPPILPPVDPIFPVPVVRAIDVDMHSVEAYIDGSVAEVRMIQRFHNRTQQTVEGAYLFPLPTDAAIGDLQLTVDGQVLEGKVYTAQEAKQIYEAIVRQQRDPALLEYVGNGLFQASVFPIPAGATRLVEFSYRQLLELENGLYRFAVPVGSRTHSNLPQSFALSVELRNQPGLRTVYSASHNVSIQRQGDDGALIGFETTRREEMTNFVLYFGTDRSAIGVNLLSYKPAGGACAPNQDLCDPDGFFLLLAAPSVEVASQEIVARDLVLVLDVSGSMQGEKIEQAKEAARFLVRNFNTVDRFNLISFSTGTDHWRSSLQPVSAESQQAALSWINNLRATGSTDINRALLEALAQLDPVDDRPAYVLFMTDGLPTMGVQDPDRIIANAEQNAPGDRTLRLFTFGVGYDVNTDLLDTLSQKMNGRSRYVRPEEAIQEAVSAFYAGISTPVLSNVSITVEGAQLADTYPYPLPDLFAGEQLVWAGRYKEGGPVTVVLRGQVNGQERTFRYPDLELAERAGESAVARLWATRKIGALLSQVRRGGNTQEIVDSIVELSLTYGIVTPYTSYLVLEPDMLVPQPGQAMAPAAPQARSLQFEAERSVGEAMAAAAAAAPSGEEAVEFSIAQADLAAARVVQESQGVRYLAGKSFNHQSTVTTATGEAIPFWVDVLYDTVMPVRTVAFGSAEYFALAADPQMAQWLSLSPEMMLVVDGEAIHITTLAEEGEEAPAPPQPATENPEEEGVWQQIVNFFKWIFGE